MSNILRHRSLLSSLKKVTNQVPRHTIRDATTRNFTGRNSCLFNHHTATQYSSLTDIVSCSRTKELSFQQLDIRRSYSTTRFVWNKNDNDDKVEIDTSSSSSMSSPFASGNDSTPNKRTTKKRRKHSFVPKKSAVSLTEKARTVFQKLLQNQPNKDGILLEYHQSSSGEPRMVFSFRFVTKDELIDQDEGVSLELHDDGTPKTPEESMNDGKPKLYVHHNAFLKVLGATVDVNTDTITPILYDKEGNVMDPNA